MQKKNLLLTTLLALSSLPGFTYAAEKNKNVEKNKVQSSVLNNKNSPFPSNSLNISHVAAFGLGALTNVISGGVGALTHKHFSDKDIDTKDKEANDLKAEIASLKAEKEKLEKVIFNLSSQIRVGAIFDKLSIKDDGTWTDFIESNYAEISTEDLGPLTLLSQHKNKNDSLDKIISGNCTFENAISTFNLLNDDVKKVFIEFSVKSMAMCEALVNAKQADDNDTYIKKCSPIIKKDWDDA